MDPQVLANLASNDGQGAQLVILAMLLLGGIGMPIPEDIPLFLAGILVARGVVSFQMMFLLCYLGVILADHILFFFGHLFGKKLIGAGTRATWLPALTEERVNAIREGLRKRRFFYIFLGRHLFPIRSATFIAAGSLGIPYLEFLFADAVACLLSISLIMGLGCLIGEQMSPELVSHMLHKAHYYILGAILFFALLHFVINRITSQRRNKTSPGPEKVLPV